MATTYSTETPIHSCFISKQTLAALEEYIVSRLVELGQGDESKIKARYCVTITDKGGNEELAGIGMFTESKFPNDIQRLRLSYYNRIGAEDCQLTITFGKDRVFTEFKMSLTADGSKKKVRDTELHLFDMLKKHETWNWLVHPTMGCITAGLVVSWWIAVGGFPFFISAAVKTQTSLHSLVSLVSLLVSILASEENKGDASNYGALAASRSCFGGRPRGRTKCGKN